MKNNIISIYVIIGIWIAVYFFDKFLKVGQLLYAKGISVEGGEVYRYFTASFLHTNIVHLLANCLAIYFITIYLERKIKGAILLFFSVLCGMITNFIISFIYKDAECIFGGSVCIFAIIGLILVMQFWNQGIEPFRLGTWYGNWMLGYVILGNIINGDLKIFDVSCVVTHGISFVVGIVLGVPLLMVMRRV